MEVWILFAINDLVMYGSTGVCKIVDIRSESFSGTARDYYVLLPESDPKATIFCPVDAPPSRIRRLLSREEVFELVHMLPEEGVPWIEGDAERRDTYRTILKKGSHRELAGLIKTLHQHRQAREKAGRKFHLADERILNQAERLLHGEIAHVLDIQPDQVVPFIVGELRLAHPETAAGEPAPQEAPAID